ncbi:sensor histidine kinase [Oribacterium sp. NK2B42]|uniref:sensor histidine kinase n=1 Tax=Oribacterium sp. NK2B42 TaxID=689781 RepID=UPI00041E92BD|nr:histidine kinase [Oribacterium sp. NK2B42]
MRMIKIDNKTFCLLVSALMFLLTFFAIAVSVRNDIFRDSMYMVRIVDLISLVFLTFLSGYLCFKDSRIGAMGYFTLFLFNLFIAVFFSALTGSVYGMPEHSRFIAVLTGIDYFFSMTFFLTLWLYQKRFLEETAVTRMVTVLISVGVIIYFAAILVNIFRPVLFLVTDGGIYSDDIEDYISILLDLFCLISLSVATLLSKLSRTRKLSFICCIFSPVLFSMLSLNLDILNKYVSVWGLATVVFMMPVCLMFFNVNDELEKDNLRYEKEQVQLQVSAMISQIQPHFLYNSLAVIEALCEEDPGLAARAISEFSEYLRENIDFADKSEPVSFSEELNHIKTYVWLEKLRFPNKLNIEFDINCTSFLVPALSVQPMVENAIKHGVCKKKDGGTVRIGSFETGEHYIVSIADDGTGFDAAVHEDNGRKHLGIENSRYRIREMVGGSLTIESTPGKGTKVTIRIPK